jgi:hypothetical protein
MRFCHRAHATADHADSSEEMAIIGDRKYIVFERQLKVLIGNQRCTIPNCRADVDETTIRYGRGRVAAGVKYTYTCRVCIVCYAAYN